LGSVLCDRDLDSISVPVWSHAPMAKAPDRLSGPSNQAAPVSPIWNR
jgi:hypothetical protein